MSHSSIRVKSAYSVPAILLSLLLCVQIAAPASAHKPIFESGGETIDTALEIPDPLVSYAIYAQFEPGMPQIQYYELQLEAGHLLNFQMLIPVIDELQEFAPEVLLIGPGLPAPDAGSSSIIDEFAIPMPTADGIVLWSYVGAENVEEFEPFTQTTFWERQDVELTLAEAGTYFLAVVVPEGDFNPGEEGKYVLAPGLEEDFGLIDYVAIPVDWVKARVFWEQSLILYLLPTFVVLLAGLSILWYRIRSSDSRGSASMAGKGAMYLGLAGGLLMVGTGVNQILLVALSPHLSESAINLVVIMTQSLAVALGLFAIRSAFALARTPRWTGIVVPVVLTLLALLLGAGFIVGPALFLTASLAQVFVGAQERSN
ncbi:MAG: hypothetical protein MUC90_02355 [Thermoplasmata archaeon]|nr:hypothetical protein [Thermoplasmata archaeon]